MWAADVVREVLPNGLTLLIQRDDSAPVVAVVTHVRAGYFDEPDEWVGIAHVLEHMYFKGTTRRAAGQLAKETRLLGGYLNASTIYDKTVYYTVLPSSDRSLERAVDLQADGLMNPAIDARELARELEVIIQEVKRKLDSPLALAGETLYELLFKVHRIRRWRMGTEEGLRRLTADAVREYYESRYTPERTIVGIVGDLDVEPALGLARQTYGEWDRPAVPVEGSPSEPDGRAGGIRIIAGDVEKPVATLGWRTRGTLHPDTPAIDVAAAILGSGRGSWLSRGIRNLGLASSASASHYTPTEVGVFEVLIQGDVGTLDRALERSTELAEQLSDGASTDADLDRVRSLVRTSWSRQFQWMYNKASAFCEFEALGDYRMVDEHYRKTLETTADDVRDVARRYLDPDAVSAVVLVPEGARDSFAVGNWPPERSSESLPSLSIPRVAEGVSGSLEFASEQLTTYAGGITHVALDGADLLFRYKPGSKLFWLGVFAPRLRELEARETAGICSLLSRVALRGAGGMDAEELSLAAESLGATIVPKVKNEAVGWSMSVHPEAVTQAAMLLRTVALEPNLETDQVALERELQASDASRVRDDMFRHPIQRVLAEAFPTDPYGLPTIGEPESVRGIEVQHLRSWHDDMRNRRAVVVAVGDIDTEALPAFLSAVLSWPGSRVAAEPVAESARWSLGRGLEEREKAQSALAMAFEAPAYASNDRFAVEVVASLLSGMAGRLFETLRDQRSLAYAVAAMPWLRRRGGAMLTYVATSPDREGEARDAMLAELDRLSREGVTESELERARNYAAGSHQLKLQSVGEVASEVLTAWLYGGIEHLHATPDRLRTVSAADVSRVASQIFNTALRAEYVVRGSGKGR